VFYLLYAFEVMKVFILLPDLNRFCHASVRNVAGLLIYYNE